MPDYRLLNQTHKYQMLDDETVVGEHWTIFVNGGPTKGGHAFIVDVPLPDCPPDKYDGYMRLVRDTALQGLRGYVAKRLNIRGPVRLRVACKEPCTIPANVAFAADLQQA